MNLQCGDGQVENLVLYLEEMLRWNEKVNLTAITEPDTAIIKHLVDSLLLKKYLEGIESVLDLGSGAGLPSIPLAIAVPGLSLVSIDGVGKKINFQKHIKRLLRLENFTAINVRTEALMNDEAFQKKFDVVTARAFTSLKDLIGIAANFIKPGGRLLAMKGPEAAREIAESQDVMRVTGFSCLAIDEFTLPGNNGKRIIVQMTGANGKFNDKLAE